jgi:hypothetical protein
MSRKASVPVCNRKQTSSVQAIQIELFSFSGCCVSTINSMFSSRPA